MTDPYLIFKQVDNGLLFQIEIPHSRAPLVGNWLANNADPAFEYAVHQGGQEFLRWNPQDDHDSRRKQLKKLYPAGEPITVTVQYRGFVKQLDVIADDWAGAVAEARRVTREVLGLDGSRGQTGGDIGVSHPVFRPAGWTLPTPAAA